VDDEARFDGVDGPRCPRAPDNARPQAFLINKGSASGVFQDDFRNGEVQHSECRGGDRHLKAIDIRLNLTDGSHLYKSTRRRRESV